MTQHRLMCERWARCLQSVAVLCPRLQRLEIRDCKIVHSNYLLEVLCKAAENDLLQSLSVVQLEGCERQAGYSMCLKLLIQLPSLERVPPPRPSRLRWRPQQPLLRAQERSRDHT